MYSIVDDYEELEFRDGKRLVPGYLARAMSGFETYRYPYKEAVAEANKQMTRDVLNDKLDNHILGHFRGMR